MFTGTGSQARIATYNMAVVPRSPVLSGLPAIDFAVSRRNRTFGHAWNAIRPAIVPLPDSMPMNTRAIVLQLVDDCDFDHVAPVGEDGGTHVLAVDEESGTRDAIWGGGTVGDLEVVLSCDASVRPFPVEVGGDVEVFRPAWSRLRAVDSTLAQPGHLPRGDRGDCGGLWDWVVCGILSRFNPCHAFARRPISIRGVI